MRRRMLTIALVAAICLSRWLTGGATVQAAGRGQPTDWNRFNYYPFVYYPHNFQRPQGSFDSLYHRYGPEQRIPVYNKNWHNFYPTEQKWYRGHHFTLDVF